MYIQNTEILLHLQTVPDQTGRQDREKGTGRGGECAACRKGGRSSPSIHLQAGAGFTHAQERPRSKACAGAGCVGGRVPGASVCLTQSPGHLFFRLPPRGGFWVGTRASGDNWPERKEVMAPWSLRWKTEACLVCPSSCLWLAWSILSPSPPHPEPPGTREE